MSSIIFYILTVILILLIIGYNIIQYFRVWRYLEKLPGPKPMPIFGNIFQAGFTPEENLNTVIKWWREYGCDKYHGYLMNKPVVIITNPKDVEQLLHNDQLIEKSFIYDILKLWLGEGLVTAKTLKWRKFRKMANPSFHFKMLIEYLEVMDRCSDIFIEKLSKYADSQEIFNIHELALNYALNVICESIFGISFSSLENSNSDILSAILESNELAFRRLSSVAKKSDFFYRFTSDYKRYQKSIKSIKEFVLEVIEKRKHLLENNNNNKEEENEEDTLNSVLNVKQKKCLLDNLLMAEVDNRPLTFDELFDEVMTFFFAGNDTIVAAILFQSYILSRLPKIQEKVLEEQLRIFGDDMKRNVTYDDIQKMQYLDLFIKEALRIFPSIPVIARNVDKTFYLGEYKIPEGTTVAPLILAMNRNEKFFKDPLKFDPMRFSPENRQNNHPFEFIPFGAGPRNCIGQKFSIFEMKTAISKLIRNYEFLPPYEKCCDKTSEHTHDILDEELQPPRVEMAIVLTPCDEIQLRLKHRKVS